MVKKKNNNRLKVSKYHVLLAIVLTAAVFAGVGLYNFSVEAAATPDSVVSTATAQSGKPYVWGASGTGSYDCSGLVYYAYQKKNKVKLANQRATANTYFNSGKKVAQNDLRKGDLVFFEKYSDGTVHHIGIYAGDNTFVHASGSYGIVLKSKFSDKVKGETKTYGDIYAGARRVLKVKGSVPTYQPLRKANKGPAVSSLQRDLVSVGYTSVKVNGKYDSATDKAVRAFQTKNKLKERGFFGPETWDCLSRRVKNPYGGLR